MERSMAEPTIAPDYRIRDLMTARLIALRPALEAKGIRHSFLFGSVSCGDDVHARTLVTFLPHPINTDEDHARAIPMLDALVFREKVSLEEKAVEDVLLNAH